MKVPAFETPTFNQNIGEQTVPDELFGCWRRNWIRVASSNGELGEEDASVTVVWLQTASGMGDLRLDPTQKPEQTDSSCGVTAVEPTEPMATADWFDGPTGFAQQAVSNFPEKGWLAWDSPTIMRELAPSGAYVEQWEKLPLSLDDAASSNPATADIVHLTAPSAPTLTNLYIAGSHYFLAVQAAAEETLHQFSYGVRSGGAGPVQIQLSTIAALTGTDMNLAFDWQTTSHRQIR